MVNTEEKVSPWEGIKHLDYKSIILCVFSFFTARVCVFESFYCIGIAYAGAIFFNKEARRWSVLLTLLGFISVDKLDINMAKYILVLLLLELLRSSMALLKGKLQLKNQLLLTGSSLLIIGIMMSFIQEVSVYKIMLCGLEVMSTLGLMSAFYLAVKVFRQEKENVMTEYELVSMALLITCFLCGLIDFYIAVPVFERIYFRDTMVFVVMIASIYLGGLESGMVVSMMMSTSLVIIGYMPTSFVALYVFAALIGGIFNRLEKIGIIFAMALGLLLSFALFNNRQIDLNIMGAYIGGAIISILIPRNYFGMIRGCEKEQQEQEQLGDLQKLITHQLKKFATAFESLGKQFQHIPCKQFTLEVSQMNELIEMTGESLCKDCAMNQFCWREYLQDTYKSCYRMIRVLDKQGSIKEADIPIEFKKACLNAESFAYTLSMMLDVYKNDCKWQQHFNEARKMIAQQFNGIADSVQRLVTKVEKELSFDQEMADKIQHTLRSKGIIAHSISVLKVEGVIKEVHIYCQYKERADYKERIKKNIEKVLDCSISIEKYTYFSEREECYLEFALKKQFSVVSSAQFSAKDKVCGDVYSYQEIGDGEYLIALADGMGSGEIARRESEMTLELLEKFLEAGFNSEGVIRLINSALVLKTEIECSSTMDLILVDEYTGIASFYKAGASSSFILREGEVITVKASSLPIGILSDVDVVSFKKQLKSGDLLIMVTDGILDDGKIGLDRETTFKHFICEAGSSNPDYVARFLMNKTKTLLTGRQNDDMTIIVSRIWALE